MLKNISLAFTFAIIYSGNTQAGDTLPVCTFEGRTIIPYFAEPVSPSSYTMVSTNRLLSSQGEFETEKEKEVRALLEELYSLRQHWKALNDELEKECNRVKGKDSTTRPNLLQNQRSTSKKSRCRCNCTIL
jgi:hypothetical protein